MLLIFSGPLETAFPLCRWATPFLLLCFLLLLDLLLLGSFVYLRGVIGIPTTTNLLQLNLYPLVSYLEKLPKIISTLAALSPLLGFHGMSEFEVLLHALL